MKIAREVKQALKTGQPVVALESTVISHGMPYPENLQTAKEVENIIRRAGAIPATIAVIEGEIKIGLSENEMKLLAQKGKSTHKISRRDIAYVQASKLTGATTVAGTMILAREAGIDVFATGGTGGVHRNARETFDISADLYELAQTRMIVVSAGVKSILDIGATLEFLETLGVPVIGYRTKDFPAFYSRRSGFPVPFTVSSPGEVARIYTFQKKRNLRQALLVANPVPEEYAVPFSGMEKFISRALEEMKENGITGKEVTPFLLEKIKDLTAGKSLETNIALIKNNARLAADIACALKK